MTEIDREVLRLMVYGHVVSTHRDAMIFFPHLKPLKEDQITRRVESLLTRRGESDQGWRLDPNGQ